MPSCDDALMTDERPAGDREITLTSATVQALMADPELADQLEAAREAGGTAALTEFLDAHGLSWREGRSDPAAAFSGDAGLDWEWFGADSEPDPAAVAEQRAQERRKSARKAQKKARKASRRR